MYERTAAVSEDKLKKLASKRPISSFKKCPPMTFVCVFDVSSSRFVSSRHSKGVTHPVQLFVVRVKETSHVKPLHGYFRPSAAPFGQKLPQFPWIVYIASEPTAHSNDGNGHVRGHVW